jgi:hypothetical protein
MGEAMLGREEHGGRRTEAEVTAVAQETERRCLSSPVFSVAGAEEGDGRQARGGAPAMVLLPDCWSLYGRRQIGNTAEYCREVGTTTRI